MKGRTKGVRFEREVAVAFEALGLEVRGLERGGDHLVVCEDGRPFHVEAKRQERLRLPEWFEQLEGDCPAGVPMALVFRQSRQRAYIAEPFEQWLDRVKRRGL